MTKPTLDIVIQALDGMFARKIPEDVDNYLESKLDLFSNLKQHFDEVSPLKPILYSYMLLNNKDIPKQTFKKQLTSSGLFNDEDLLEFVLLVSEKQRTFEDIPRNAPDDELGKYFFDKYRKPDENWNTKTFRFFLENNTSYQTGRELIIEEVAIRMIARSRASLEKAITIPPKEISELIQSVNDYFQKAFHSVLELKPPLSLTEVTYLTREYTEHADRISNKTFIQIDHFYRDRNKFVHLVIHEGMHLCFDGFYETPLEEGLIELLIEKMYQKNPPSGFLYSPVSETYSRWKENFKSMFRGLPEAESYFVQYFLTQNVLPLKNYLKTHLTKETIDRITEGYYSSGLSSFLCSINELIK